MTDATTIDDLDADALEPDDDPDAPALDLAELTERIVASYHELDLGHHLGPCPLPSYEAVVGLTGDLLGLLFPGYGRRQNLHAGNLPYHVGSQVDSLCEAMTEQFGRALRHDFVRELRGRDPDADPCVREADFREEGADLAARVLAEVPVLRGLLVEDVRAAYDGDPAAQSYDEILFCYPGVMAVCCHRLAHVMHLLGVPLVPRMIAEWSHRRTGIDIHPGAVIGPGFFIDHGTGVVIGETCEIHGHVKLYQGVTLGAKSFARDGEGRLVRHTKRHPTIERDVVIYSNATVLGGDVTVGAGSVIGAGVTLTKSVPENTQVTVDKPSLRFREKA